MPRGILLVICVLGVVVVAADPAFAQRSRSQRQAQASWWDRAPVEKVGHYWIKTDLPGRKARPLAKHLNIMYQHYARRLAGLPLRADEKLNVLIFKSREEYLRTMRTRFGIELAGSGGAFFRHPQLSGLAFYTEDLPRRRIEHVIQHEGFHQFAYSRFGGDLPIWVNEGLAEFFGNSVVVDGELIIGQATPRVTQSIREAIENNEYIPFRRMLTMESRQWNNAVKLGDAKLQYEQAWSMVHFLVYGDNGRYVGAFERYLRLINNAVPSDVAFIRAFGIDDGFQQFENRWKQYAMDAKPSAFMTALQRIEFLAEGAHALARQGKYVTALDELKSALQHAGFTHTITVHNSEVTLKAEMNDLYRIPNDDLANEKPVFVVKEPNPRYGSLRERRLEEQNPTPPTIHTKHLEPRELKINWIRDEQTNTFTFEIEVD